MARTYRLRSLSLESDRSWSAYDKRKGPAARMVSFHRAEYRSEIRTRTVRSSPRAFHIVSFRTRRSAEESQIDLYAIQVFLCCTYRGVTENRQVQRVIRIDKKKFYWIILYVLLAIRLPNWPLRTNEFKWDFSRYVRISYMFCEYESISYRNDQFEEIELKKKANLGKVFQRKKQLVANILDLCIERS